MLLALLARLHHVSHLRRAIIPLLDAAVVGEQVSFDHVVVDLGAFNLLLRHLLLQFALLGAAKE